MDPAVSAKWQQNLQSSVNFFFCAAQLNAHDKELVPFSERWSSAVSACLVFLLTQTNKRQKHAQLTAFTESEGERISDHCSVRCIRRSADKQHPRSLPTTRATEQWKQKSQKRMTASVLKQDPNTKRFKRTLIYYDTDTQSTNFRGNPLRQATRRHLYNS